MATPSRLILFTPSTAPEASSIPEESGTPPRPFIIFDTLYSLALFLLLVTYIAALISKSIVRMKTWFCLLLSCIVYCISFLILVGHQDSSGSDSQPPFYLCIFQAGLIYAAPPTVAAAGVSFVVELYMRLSSSLTATEVSHRKITALMFFSPIIHLMIFWEAVFYGLSHQQLVVRINSGMYCHVGVSIPRTVTGITVGILVIIMIALEAYTGYYLWKRRSGFTALRFNGTNNILTPKLFIRVAVYTLGAHDADHNHYSIIDISLNIFSLDARSVTTLNSLAIIPLLVAILFGAQTEYLKVYMFWRKKRPVPAVESRSPPKTETKMQDEERCELDVV
ncbi:hypothetical protein D9758_014178 [Tetrapyrgos nigripes]|uniref:Uncharacterized protein n=1 Tax=Tetrapyrgos nigripes TaxID=182062 RepID=A0A8H5CM52_9AGAR|nr:hypothetical protein D9758_014178 [Tetrapyrgos nigripes]